MTKFSCKNRIPLKTPKFPNKTNTKTNVLLLGICMLSCLFWVLCFGIWNSFVFAQDKIIAVVNNEIITQKDLNEFINFVRMQLSREFTEDQLEKKIQSMKPELQDKLIEDRLILQEAKKNQIKVDENIVKSKINEIKKRYGSDTEFQGDLAKQGLVQADIETKIREQFLIYSIIESKIRDKIFIRPDEVTAFYNNNLKEFTTPEERELEVIILENKDLADTFAYNLKTGQKLADLAIRYPLIVDKLKIGRRGELRKEIEDVVFKLFIGEISDPISIDGKYYIFKLGNIIPPRQQTLSEVQAKIHAFLFDRKMQEELKKWLDELKKQSYIKVIQD